MAYCPEYMKKHYPLGGMARLRKMKIMNKQLLLVAILFLAFAVTGCSLIPVRQASKPEKIVISNIKRADLNDSKAIRNKMYRQYQQWKGTPYAFGGLSKEGIDCSGFVYRTYLEELGIKLPRSTKLLSKIGTKIMRDELRPGDLVFFKTGFKVRHVGIYIEKDNFLHASKKRGVMISNLKDYYWKDKYWHARRVG